MDWKKAFGVFYVWGKTNKEDLKPTAQDGGVQKYMKALFIYFIFSFSPQENELQTKNK